MTRSETRPPRRGRLTLVVGVAAVLLFGAVVAVVVRSQRPLDGVGVELVADGLDRPLAIAFTGQPGQIFIAQQAGLVRLVEDGSLQPDPVLDLTDRVERAGEKGMLGLALHPQFAENRLFYVSYTSIEDDTILAEYVASDGVHADPASARELLRLPQESDYHKGGSLVFGPDGFLYVSIGDDAWPRGTTPDFADNFRGSIIRIDVDGRDGEKPYGIPEGNAFAEGDGPPEIWDYGFRNPWRMSIDPESGDLYVADVGSERYEEVGRHRGDEPPGLDFGWGAWEGFECRRHQIREELNCDEWADAEKPLLAIEGGEFASGDCAVIGGYVYRGEQVSALKDRYVFGDYCSGRLRIIPTDQDEPIPEIILDSEVRMSTFAVDPDGELYVADVDNGLIYKLIAAERPDPTPSGS